MSHGTCQIGIGTSSPHSSALLHLESTNSGLLIPRMTNSQMLAIPSPATGLLVFNTTNNQFYVFRSGSWQLLSSGLSDNWGSQFALTSGLITGKGTIGDSIRLVNGSIANQSPVWNGSSWVIGFPQAASCFWDRSGNYLRPANISDSVGIGISTPSYPLHVKGNINTDSSLFIQSKKALSIGTNKVVIGESPFHDAGNGLRIGFHARGNGITIGNQSGSLNAASSNIIIGHNSGTSITTGSDILIIGNNSGNGLTTSSSGVIIGNNAAVSATGIGVAIGDSAAFGVSGAAGVFIGNKAARVGSNVDAVAIGFEAGINGIVAKRSTYEGYRAGGYGSYNVSLGSEAGLVTTGTYNTLVGYRAGFTLTTGSNNVFIGALSGQNVTTASNNVFIGYNTGFTSTTQYTNAHAIGYNARVGANNSLVLGGTGVDAVNVGINTTTPVERLHVEGNIRFSGTFKPNNQTGTLGQILVSQGGSLPPIWSNPTYTDNLGSHIMTQNLRTNNFWISNDGSNNGIWVKSDGSVGIGTNNPTYTLHVIGTLGTTGSITIPNTGNYNYATAQPRTLSVPATNFSSVNPVGYVETLDGSGSGVFIGNGTAGIAGTLVCPINIPDGATITGLDARVIDNNTSFGMTISLRSTTPTTGATSPTITTHATVSSTVNSPNIQNIGTTSITTPVVNNTLRAYYVQIDTRQNTNNLVTYQVIVSYTVTRAD
ncbi:MAG: hypothetical protein NZ108_04590 [Bacteroidia bacterium]|nr:hypothetical protein [Bacteroidia bacterium]